MNSNEETAKDAPYFQLSGTLIHALNNWASILENFPYGLGALVLNIVLFQAKLVPPWLSVWGLIGAALLIAMGFLRLFGHNVILLAIPIILNEIVLAIWLIGPGFNSSAVNSTIVGVLIITALGSSMVSGTFLGSIDDPDYLNAISANKNKVLIGVLFMVTLTISVVSIPIMMFPIMKEFSVSIAFMYIGARIFEGGFDIVIAISHLLILTLSQEFVKAGPPTAETDINEIK